MRVVAEIMLSPTSRMEHSGDCANDKLFLVRSAAAATFYGDATRCRDSGYTVLLPRIIPAAV